MAESVVVSVRLPVEVHGRWKELAAERGMTLTGFLRVAVEESGSSRSAKGLAADIASELAPLLSGGLDGFARESVFD